MKRILVPIDFSTGSLAVLKEALQYTQAVRGELLLLHVIEGDPVRWYAVDGGPEPPSSRYDPTGYLLLPPVPSKLVHRDLGEEAQWKLTALLPPRCERFRTLVTVGKVAEEIVRVAREQNADLIIMGTQRRRGLWRWLRRSVTDQVCQKAPVPVLTVDGQQLCLSRTPVSSSQEVVERQVTQTTPAMAPEETVDAGARGLQGDRANPKRLQRARRVRRATWHARSLRG